MAISHLLVVIITGIFAAFQSACANPVGSSAGQVQLVPLQSVQLVPVIQQELPVDQQQVVYFPFSSSSSQPYQYTLVNKVEPLPQQPVSQSHQQGSGQQGVVEHTQPPHNSLLPYQAEAIHHAIHSPPPAPSGATSAYVASLSYGPGYPALIYNCYQPGVHPPPSTKGDYLVNGTNGYKCVVHYQHSGHYHLVHVVSNSQSAPANSLE